MPPALGAAITASILRAAPVQRDDPPPHPAHLGANGPHVLLLHVWLDAYAVQWRVNTRATLQCSRLMMVITHRQCTSWGVMVVCYKTFMAWEAASAARRSAPT